MLCTFTKWTRIIRIIPKSSWDPWILFLVLSYQRNAFLFDIYLYLPVYTTLIKIVTLKGFVWLFIAHEFLSNMVKWKHVLTYWCFMSRHIIDIWSIYVLHLKTIYIYKASTKIVETKADLGFCNINMSGWEKKSGEIYKNLDVLEACHKSNKKCNFSFTSMKNCNFTSIKTCTQKVIVTFRDINVICWDEVHFEGHVSVLSQKCVNRHMCLSV